MRGEEEIRKKAKKHLQFARALERENHPKMATEQHIIVRALYWALSEREEV